VPVVVGLELAGQVGPGPAGAAVAEQQLPGWLAALQAAAQRRGERPAEIVLTANSETVARQVRSAQGRPRTGRCSRSQPYQEPGAAHAVLTSSRAVVPGGSWGRGRFARSARLAQAAGMSRARAA